MSDPHVTIELVTPEVAEQWLAANRHNRTIRPAVVARYSRDMRSGYWVVTGAPIIFDASGRLVDGQHRLAACIEAQTSFMTCVMRSADPDIHPAIDTGLGRTLRDELAWRGEQSVSDLAAIIQADCRWAQGAFSELRGNVVTTTREALQWLDANPGLRDAAREGKRWRTHTHIASSVLGIFWYRAGEGADEFLQSVADGTELRKDDPEWHLRKATESWLQQSARHIQVSSTVKLAFVIKAWNAWAGGAPLGLLRWTPRKERFPILVRVDGSMWPPNAEGSDSGN